MSQLGVWDFVIFLISAGAIVWYCWFLRNGHDDRHEEDGARAFFDEHGHWPDEDPSEANRRYEL